MPDTSAGGATRYITPALIGLGILAAAYLLFGMLNPSKPAPEPKSALSEAAQVGPRERYGLTPQEEAALTPAQLAERALSKSSLDLVQAAAAEDPLSGAVLCSAQFTGVGAAQDDVAAAQTCATARAQGSMLATYVLSELTRAGRGGLTADALAADNLLREAAATDARAQYAMAMTMRTKRSMEGRALFEKCAAQGMVDCEFEFARMRQLGISGPRDTAAALATYKKLTETSFHPAGTREYGRMFLSGEGLPARDTARGVDLLKRAEVLEDAEASFLLGQQAEKGEGVPTGEALAYYRRAAERGYAPAQEAVTRLSAE
jgi:TPR repeat protein